MNEVNEYENILRTLIILVLNTEYDSDYSDHFGVTSGRLEKWAEKRDEYNRKMKGISVEQRIIYFADFYDLKNIVTSNWILFKKIFSDKKRFELFFDEIEKYRNELAHGRELLEYQRNLISGLVGELKTRLIQYRNKNIAIDDFYVKILKINDNIGNIYDSTTNNVVMMNKLIKPGDVLEFKVDAYDPKGRDIYYFLRIDGIPLSKKIKVNELQFKVKEEHISKYLDVRVVALTEAKYDNSDGVSFSYSVIPNE